MAEEKKILYSVEIEGNEELLNELARLRRETAELKNENKDYNRTLKSGEKVSKEQARNFERNTIQIKQNNASIRNLTKELQGANIEKDNARKRLTEMRRSLQEMALAGDTSSEAYRRLRGEAAELQDAIDRVNREVKIFADDAMVINTVVDATRGLTAGFQGVLGVQALLGFESEKFRQTMQRLVAVQQVSNALQTVSNLLQKESRLVILGKVAAVKIATAAQWAWNAAMTANPIGLIVAGVAALGAGVYALVRHFDSVTAAIRRAADWLIFWRDLGSEVEKVKDEVQEIAESMDSINKGFTTYHRKSQQLSDELDKQVRLLNILGVQGGLTQVITLQNLQERLKLTKETIDEQQNELDGLNELREHIDRLVDTSGDLSRADVIPREFLELTGWYEEFERDFKGTQRDVNKLYEFIDERRRDIIKSLGELSEELIALDQEHYEKQTEIYAKTGHLEERLELEKDIIRFKEGEIKNLSLANEKAKELIELRREQAEAEREISKALGFSEDHISRAEQRYIDETKILEEQYIEREKLIESHTEKLETAKLRFRTISMGLTVLEKQEAEEQEIIRQERLKREEVAAAKLETIREGSLDSYLQLFEIERREALANDDLTHSERLILEEEFAKRREDLIEEFHRREKENEERHLEEIRNTLSGYFSDKLKQLDQYYEDEILTHEQYDKLLQEINEAEVERRLQVDEFFRDARMSILDEGYIQERQMLREKFENQLITSEEYYIALQELEQKYEGEQKLNEISQWYDREVNQLKEHLENKLVTQQEYEMLVEELNRQRRLREQEIELQEFEEERTRYMEHLIQIREGEEAEFDRRRENYQQWLNDKIISQDEYNKAIERLDEDLLKFRRENAQAQAQAMLMSYRSMTQGLSQLMDAQQKESSFFKAMAIADATIALALGLAQTWKIGFPQAIPMAIGYVAQTAGLINQIMQTQQPTPPRLAKGGMIGGKPHSQGGTVFRGSDGSIFEAERGEYLAIVNKKDATRAQMLDQINQEHGEPFGTTTYGDGGIFHTTIRQFDSGGMYEPRQDFERIDMSDLIREVVDEIGHIPVVVTERDISSTQNRVRKVEVKGDL